MPSMLSALSVLANLDISLAARSVADHARFAIKDGVIESIANRRFHLSLNGVVHSGDAVKLGDCAILPHEKFEMYQGQVRLAENSQMCLNAKGGVFQGADIATYPCSAGGKPTDNELFEHGDDGRIRAKKDRDLCMNIKQGLIEHGMGIALYKCGTNPNHKHDQFGYKDQTFFVVDNPKLRLHVKDVNMQHGSEVVLGGCDHDIFDFDSQTKQLRLHGTDLCVNAENGIGGGANLIAWQCAGKGQTVPENQQFEYDRERDVITAVKDTNLGFNIKGAAIDDGTPIVLYPLVTEEEM